MSEHTPKPIGWIDKNDLPRKGGESGDVLIYGYDPSQYDPLPTFVALYTSHHPVLLECAKALLSRVDYHFQMAGRDIATRERDALRAAIAKAEGREP